MQKDELDKVQKALTSALGVRYHVSSLLDLAHEITIVSLNSQITSAQIGDAGRVFSVMTSEITDISAALRETVKDIRRLTQELTKLTAVAAQQIRRLRSLDKAGSIAKNKGKKMDVLEKASVQPMRLLKSYQENYPRLLRELLAVIGGMEKSLKIVNYVKIGILIESERLSGTDSNELSPFQHLTNEMQTAADSIRNVAQQTIQLLSGLSTISFNKQKSLNTINS
jgi:hypothetical protein